MNTLLEALLSLSEKTALIARHFHMNKASMLIEEKSSEAKNKRFTVDYKTVADTLIQVVFKHFLGEQFPELSEFIFGEENNLFTNTHGEIITVTIGPSVTDTVHMLSRLLVGHKESTLMSLVEIIHDKIQVSLGENVREKLEGLTLTELKIGAWIDPIDATNEYVRASTSCHDNGLFSHGLQCVTILVGVFNQTTGQPVMGVVNQPFCRLDGEGVWHGRGLWGLPIKSIVEIPPSDVKQKIPSSHKVCVTSSSEDTHLIEKLQSSSEWKVLHVAGCGYKLLCVIDGLADAFVLSRPSTYKWDTCGPQAILMAMGGNIVSIEETKELGETAKGLLYNEPNATEDKWANRGGIIAYSSKDVYLSLCNIIQQL